MTQSRRATEQKTGWRHQRRAGQGRGQTARIRLLAAMAIGLAVMAAIGAATAARAQQPTQPPEEVAIAANVATNDAFRLYVESLWPQARAQGVKRATFERALAEMTFDGSVLEKANAQPEHEFSMADYLSRLASSERVAAGQALLAQHAALFQALEQAYGVDRHVLVAIWGIESNYGAGMGVHRVVSALATLAWKGGKRSDFGRQQLIAALQILEKGDVDPAHMTGSWAGAMGHTQFIPTTYRAYAVDFDKDGRRDIWTTIDDALASTAHYLRVSGWKPGLPWGFEVALPAGFDINLMDQSLPMAEWARRGVERAAPGRPVPTVPHRAVADPDWASTRAALYLPAGANGPAFLLTANFAATLKYNNANSYALAVGHLSDRLAGAAAIAHAWPREERPLRRLERQELQSLLAAHGFYRGEVDGQLGRQTKDALIAWQRRAGLVPDAYASSRALALLKQDTPEEVWP